MRKLEIKTDPRVPEKFKSYPKAVKPKMDFLRKLVLETAQEIESISSVEETLKWGEPSFLVKKGSTLRMDWKAKAPDQYAIYFKCTSRLGETFKVVFKDVFKWEGKRAIIFQMDDEVPVEPLKACIKAALTYHTVKQLPTLGI